MKNKILILFLFAAPVAYGQTSLFSAGITYCNGAPAHNPGNTGSRYAIDTVTYNLYIRRHTNAWGLIGNNWIQNISGCSAPAYTPTKYNPQLAINTCNPKELYAWDGAAWDKIAPSSSTTDLSFSGTTSPVTLNSSTGTDVQFRDSTGIAIRGIPGKMTILNTGDLSATNELQTIANTSDATSHTVTLSNSGGTVQLVEGTGVTLTTTGTSGAGIVTIAATATGTVTGAENGTNIVANKVRLGGPLLATTSIEGDNFELRYFDGKVSFSSWTAFANTPTQFFQVQALEALPTTATSPTYDGILDIRAHNSSGSDQPNSLTFGAYPTDADGVWMQSRSFSNPSVEYPLSMQPRGGKASIGRTTGLDAHFTVTATALTGSTASGSVLLLENSEGGKASMGLGSGADNVTGEIAMFTTDVMRITNRNSTNGTSSVRVAVGGETSDVATFEKSAATSLVQFGVGTTTPHSTIQSAGSLAAAYLETVGAPTFDETKRTVVYTANANITWTIPTAAACACQGREYILHHAGTAGTITLSQAVSKGNGTTFNTISAGQWAYITYGAASIRGYKISSL